MFGSLVFSLSGKNKQKPCWSFKLQRCILPFSRTSSEEVQAPLKGCLLLLIFDIFWYTQLPKTTLGYWDLLCLHLQACRLKSGFAEFSGLPLLLVEDSGRVLLNIFALQNNVAWISRVLLDVEKQAIIVFFI